MDCTDKVIEIKNVRVAFEDFAPTSVTDSIVVSRDSVRILKNNSCVEQIGAWNMEKCWMVAGPEFGSEEGKTFLVVNKAV
jgi:hypothetical protein